MSEDKIPVRMNTNLNNLLSTKQYSTPEKAILEFIQNSLDAHAETIVIMLTDTTITFCDDGDGMTKEGIIKFLTYADDWKEKQKVSSRGQQLRGSHGIGRLAGWKLGKKYWVSTRTKDDKKRMCRKFLMDKLTFKVGTEITISDTEWRSPGTGTDIVILELENKGSPIKDVENLKEEIRDNYDVRSKAIFVNGDKVLPSEYFFEKGFERAIHATPEGVNMSGVIGISTGKNKQGGILIRVKDRGVGKTHDFGLRKNNSYTFLLPRLIGHINVDELHPYIMTGREGILEDNHTFAVVKKYMKKEISSLFDDFIGDQKKKNDDSISKEVMDWLKKNKKIINDFFNKYLVAREMARQGKGGEVGGDDEMRRIIRGGKRRGGGDGNDEGGGASIDGTINVDKNSKTGKIKIGSYSWLFEMKKLGEDQKLVVVDFDSLQIIWNTDHPVFKKYVGKNKDKIPIFWETVYAISLETEEDLDVMKLRDNVDNLMRAIIKNEEIL